MRQGRERPPHRRTPIQVNTALIYLRIVNRTSEHASIDQQRADCNALADQLGYARTIEFVDEAVSAYKDRTRPAYHRLLASLERGEATTIIVWHLDRIYRKPGELEQLLDLLDTRPVRIESALGGTFDLNLHEGRLFARQLVAFANYESAHKSVRTTRAQQHRAQNGLWHGGPAYGYQAGGVLHTDQAPVLRRIARDYLAGCSETEIARRLDADGIPTPGTSQRWRPSSVQAILRSDRLHRQRITATGEHVAGVWESVITTKESALIRALQLLPQHRTTNSSRSLLGGLARCAACGRTMVVRYSGCIRRYVCLRRDGGCGNGIAADALDHIIGNRFSGVEPIKSVARPTQELAKEAHGLRQQLMDNAVAFATGSVQHHAFSKMSRTFQQQAEQLSATVVSQTSTRRGDWDGTPLPELRRIIQRHATAILIYPSRVPGRFDPSRLRIQWPSHNPEGHGGSGSPATRGRGR